MKLFIARIGIKVSRSHSIWCSVRSGRDSGQNVIVLQRKGLEKIQKRASIGLARYPIERKTHQSLLTQHLRDVSDRLKSVPPRLISTSFSIVYSPPFSKAFFLLFFTFISASRSRYHAAMIDIRNYIRVVLRSSISRATMKNMIKN